MEGFEGANFTASQAMFFLEKAAMIHMGSWLVSEMADVIPEDFVVGTFDFPTRPRTCRIPFGYFVINFKNVRCNFFIFFFE